MASSADLSDADRYVVGRLAARDHVPVDSLAGLPAAELDQLIPGARQSYERRQEIAAALQRQLGIDPESDEYQTAAREARAILARVDQLGSDDPA